MTAQFLEREGEQIDVVTETSASDGLDRLADETIDCIVSDYQMPGMDGLEFLGVVREEYPDLPFLLFTGRGSEEVASDAITAGATDYLQKGSGTERYELLANRVLNAVDQYRSKRRAAELDRIRTLASDVNQALVRAESRDDIETRVCEIISDSDPYLFAWIGDVDPETDRIEPRTLAGFEDGYLDDITVTADESPTGQGPGGTAIRERRVAVSQNVTEDPEFEPWREEALERGYRAVAAVPLEYEETLYGELVVYAERADAFDDDEQNLLAELGSDIAHAIHAIDIRENLLLYKRAVESSSDLLAAVDTEYNFLFANERYREFHDISSDDITALSVPAVLGEAWELDVKQKFDRALEGEVVQYEMERTGPNGDIHTFDIRYYPLTEENRILGIVGAMRDITELKEREQELGELAQYNREIVMNAPVGLFRLDDQMRITYENERAEEIVGVPEGEDESPALGRDLRELPSVQGTDAIEALNQLEAGEIVSFDTSFESIFGKESYLTGKGVPLFDNGTFDGAIIMVVDITERKERERAIEELHSTTHALMEATTSEDVAETTANAVRDILEMPANGVHLYDESDGGLVPVAWTDRTEEIVGEPPTFAPGEGLAGTAFETGEPQIYDDISTVPDRFNLDTDIRSQIIYPLDDHGVLVIGSPEPDAFDDIDTSLAETLADHATTALDRITQDQELREERDFIDQALDTLDDLFYVVGPDGELRRWNERLPEVTGYTDDDIADMQAVDFFPEDERERIGESIEEALTTGHTTIEADVLTAYGDRIPYEFRGVRLTDPAGDLFGLVGIGRDITERKEREEKLTRRQSLFEAILETSIDGILVIDENREYVTWNQQFVDMWGIPEELLGDKPEEEGLEYVLDKLEDPQEFIDKVEYLYEHPHEESRDEIRLADGRVFDRYSAPVEANDGTYFGRVWFFRDITEQETREQELTQQNERLEEFARVVSHDLRNPLNVAEGRLELAREQYDSEHLDSAANAVDRSLSLIEDLLTLAREGEHASGVEPVDLGEMCDGCWQYVETTDATLVNEADRTIRAEPGRLKQLLENLMRNAVEHGGEEVTVTIGDLDDGFYIADDGPGIPEDERDQVFDAGYSTAEEGTGFGLNIVQEIAEAHDWTIRVTDSEAGGARFEITGVESAQ